ncbi:hypothetical protein BCR42DRAFT_386171 [Absidia repens]|uniref:NAD(P)-binding domain-containing protein n=1 Tax=Absidia repens TaxID=90262 RepID=A0A1X2J150_9FUNG|nr:hypothetical protein BCR42DRAFT_386171 [Absidia repens]
MRIAVLGGSKGCAREMVAQGLSKPDSTDEFVLLVRNPDHVEYDPEQKAKLTLIKGDAHDPTTVRQLVEGADIVVTSIGSGVTATLKMTMPNVCEKGIKVLLDVIGSIDDPARRPRRLVAVSTTGAIDGGEVPFLFRPLYHLALAEAHKDKKALEDHITSTAPSLTPPLDYVIIRPSLLTNGPLTGQYRTDNKRLVGYTISRTDIGHFLLEQCLDDEKVQKWVNQYVVVTY